jgi:glycosyltransferase involved in cell wall biosynthesis
VSGATEVEEKPFVIIIPSYNNAPYYQKNLDSVFFQEYDHWRAIYIDDASTDGTGDLVEAYIKEKGFTDKFTVIRNPSRSLAMANIYHAVHSCNDREIIATLDGDDWFDHPRVLKLLNDHYQDPSVWLTYGSYIDWPEPEKEKYESWIQKFGGFKNRPIPQEVIANNDFRFFIGCTGQLRTFYGWLFKKIKLEDLMYQGHFLPVAYDIGIMIPMHEMAAGRFKYIPEIIYIHNVNTPLNDYKVNTQLQSRVEAFIRHKEKYQPLSDLYPKCFDKFKLAKADLVIFSFDRPLQLYALLESIELYVKGIHSISIIYRTSNDRYERAYQDVQTTFSDARFLKQQDISDFKTLTLKAINSTPMEHILFAVDDNLVKDDVNLSECIEWLERTQAYGFYLKLGSHLNYCYTMDRPQKVPANIQIKENIRAWQFEFSEADWNYPNTVDMTLYRKKDLFSLFGSFNYTNPNWLEWRWASWWVNHKSPTSVGLFYENSKILNVPLNRVQTDILNRTMNLYSQEELLEKFEQGLKVDIQPLYQIKNQAVHVEYEPTFISREKK